MLRDRLNFNLIKTEQPFISYSNSCAGSDGRAVMTGASPAPRILLPRRRWGQFKEESGGPVFSPRGLGISVNQLCAPPGLRGRTKSCVGVNHRNGSRVCEDWTVSDKRLGRPQSGKAAAACFFEAVIKGVARRAKLAAPRCGRSRLRAKSSGRPFQGGSGWLEMRRRQPGGTGTGF
ncbi:hypothetical protein SKAU_G00363610 [Synaphobranchus kaupii]|uniref:Uncharacterized protein n=1 Tax=Synaphobranchus kaupii TaxID=118154 RepID=A0A9Q1EIU7_SYNKA|nr:hypothetical protein SKAU_G00363610 [Synaphobranchus kaupii]